MKGMALYFATFTPTNPIYQLYSRGLYIIENVYLIYVYKKLLLTIKKIKRSYILTSLSGGGLKRENKHPWFYRKSPRGVMAVMDSVNLAFRDGDKIVYQIYEKHLCLCLLCTCKFFLNVI